jgi:hypothetical protein
VLPQSQAGLELDPAAFRDLLADPQAVESLSAVTGCPLLVVDAADGVTGEALAGLDIAGLPAVVAVLAPDPGCLPAAGFAAADVVLTEDAAAPAPFTAPPGGVRAGLDAIGTALTASPVAAATLVLLLRGSAGMAVPAALVAESAAYSALQAGAEFRRWRSAHPPRPAEPGTGRVAVARSAGEMRITLSRPGRRNAVDWRMRDALAGALAVAVREPGLRVRLTGAGPDFCAGGDLDEFGARPDPAVAHLTRLTRSPARLLHQLSARTTAYLHGACLGAGLELPAFASRVVAAPGARLGLPELRLGLLPGAGGTVSLPRRIGRSRTAYLALTGLPVDAETALAWGLVDAIGAPGEPS